MKKKILYITSTLKTCAPSTQLWYILRGLDRQQYVPIVLTLSPESFDSSLPGIAKLGVEIESLGLSRRAGVVLGARRLQGVLNRIRPDLVHSCGFRPDVLAAQVNKALPTVATIRNYPFHDYPMKFGRLRGRGMAWIHRIVLSRFHTVVPCSYAIAGLFGHSRLDFHVIQDGIDTDNFSPASSIQREQIRKEWGVGPDEEVFVTAGSLIPRKDPLTLIRGFLRSSVVTKGHLFVLGEGPLFTSCLKEAGGQRRVRLFGHVRDVRTFLQGSDYYVSASHSEGLPNAVLEALACGLPVALSDIPSHREQVHPSPVAGELFPVGDESGLGGALERMIMSDRKTRSEAAVALVNQHFSARKMSLAYQALYCSLLDGHREP